MSEFEATLRALLATGHAARFRATGDSMYPTIRDGDCLHVVPCETSRLRRGDVILAASERGLTAHRIVRIRESGGAMAITTRGDNAFRSDASIEAADVLARVEQISRGGSAPRPPGEPPAVIRFAVVAARRARARFSLRAV